MPDSRQLRMLAVVARFNWLHIGYLRALAGRFDLTAVSAGEYHPGAVAQARAQGLRVVTLPESGHGQAAALAEVISAVSPEVVHTLYHHHEALTVLVRELAPDALLVYECRDPLSTLVRAPGTASEKLALERGALEASDRQLFVSDALRRYLEELHDLDLGASSMLVPNGFELATLAPPAPKLSAADGETHLALIGTASEQPGHSRYYVDIIDRLTDLGFVVHSHFFELEPGDGDAYRALARRNRRYHPHKTVSPLGSTKLSQVISRYDVMGVFYDLDAVHHRDNDKLAVCQPAKATSGWFHGGIPAVCSRYYASLVELIDAHGIGFTYVREQELVGLVEDRRAITAATERTLAIRTRFSHEWSARRIERFVRPLRDRAEPAAAAHEERP